MGAILSLNATRRLRKAARLTLVSTVLVVAGTQTAPAQGANPQAAPIGKLVSVTGAVRVSEGGESAGKLIEQDGLVYPGDGLRAEEDAGYQLHLADHRLTTGPYPPLRLPTNIREEGSDGGAPEQKTPLNYHTKCCC